MHITTKDLIASLKPALFAFRDKLGDDLMVLRIESLALVVTEPGVEQKEAGHPLNVSAAAVGRNLRNLGRRKVDGTPGPDFALARKVVLPGRGAARNAWYPTDKALHWLERLAGKINKDAGLILDAVKLAAVLREAMRRAREATDTEVAIYRLLVLLLVLEQPGISHTELEMLGKIDATGISRSVRNLSAINEKGEPGPDMVAQQIDPLSPKERRVYPTIKAQQWLETVTAKINAKFLNLKPD